jgi:hypothetical protein
LFLGSAVGVILRSVRRIRANRRIRELDAEDGARSDIDLDFTASPNRVGLTLRTRF